MNFSARFKTLASVRFAAFAATLAFAVVPAPADQTSYHIVDKQHLEGDAKWDYMVVDAASRHLFITHGDRVDVFDIEKKKVIGSIPNTQGVHGVALVPELDRGYTSNGKDNAVTIFELSTLKIVGSAATGKKPDAIVYDAVSKRVFAANGESGSLTPIDTATGAALPAIPLGGKPEFSAVDGKGSLFVNLEDKNEMVVVDTRALSITHRYDLSAHCDEPAGLSIDLSAHRLFVGCHNQKMAIVDADTGKTIDTVAIGRGSDATAFDPQSGLAFSSNADGTLNIVSAKDATRYQIKQTLNTMPGAKTMAIDSVTHNIYLAAGEVDSAGGQQPPGSRLKYKPGTFTLITVAP